ncbi:MAG: GNAT family N-acetyltransferase [bacterium]|nr:GNAT family N-acetyltransferase [bacterium]
MASEDLPAVIDLYRTANLFAHKKDIRTWTARGLERFPSLHLVAEDSERIVGAISATLQKRAMMQIEDVAVSADRRNTGVGSRLMKELLRRAGKNDVCKIVLWVHWRNAQAIPFYYRHGFKLSRVVQTRNISFVPNGEDVIVMKKSL